MIGYYNYTVILTYIGTVSGFMGITFILQNELKLALLCLIFAGLCDMFDGKIASTMTRTKEEKSFGIQIDSLSDLICFGVLPSLIIYHCSTQHNIYKVVSAIFVLCALIRLAWFNVDEEIRQSQESGSRQTYLGLPVTTSALIIPFIVGLGCISKLDLVNVYPWVLLVVGAAFLTPFKTKKPHLLGKIIMMLLGAGSLAVVLIGVPA